MSIQWEEKYSVGVKEIDEQHKRFIDILNSLYAAVYASETREKLEEILVNLIKYKNNHFETEEKYFDLYDYENSDEHKKEHQEITKRINEFYKQFKEKRADITLELMDFLENWLVDHVDQQDQKYVECFRKNGLK